MKKFSLFLASGLLAVGMYAQSSVTFQVDMSNESSINPSGVSVAGSFQDEAGATGEWKPGETMMTDPDGDKVYTVTVTIPDGTYAYKFINGVAWGSDESVPSACNVGNNREVVVAGNTTIPVVCYASCIACPTVAPDTLYATFHLDMRNHIKKFGKSFTSVHVAGGFQGKAGFPGGDWQPNTTELTDADGDSIYTVTVRLPEGAYPYKFIAGNTWDEDELVPSACAAGGNREFNLSGNQDDTMDIPVTCFSECGACGAFPAPFKATFNVNMENEIPADTIWVGGSFIYPKSTPLAMADADGDGIYTLSVNVYPGEFGYKFRNGRSAAETGDFKTNGCGLGDFGNNRKLTIPASIAADTTLPAFFFNSCDFTSSVDGRINTAFTVAPNPFTNRTTVTFNEAGVYNVALISVAGQVVRSISDVRTNAVEISREGINAGLYLLAITNESGVRTIEKVVIE